MMNHYYIDFAVSKKLIEHRFVTKFRDFIEKPLVTKKIEFSKWTYGYVSLPL
jgi:hypothetical protein